MQIHLRSHAHTHSGINTYLHKHQIITDKERRKGKEKGKKGMAIKEEIERIDARRE